MSGAKDKSTQAALQEKWHLGRVAYREALERKALRGEEAA